MATNFINPGTFTIGPMCSITILDQNGNEFPFGAATQINFSTRQISKRVPVDLMAGYKIDLVFDEGWGGEIMVQRTSAALDVYWSAFEAALRAGLARPVFTIMMRIQESDGTISNGTYFDCQITYDDAGTFANEEGVVQKFSYTGIARIFENV